MNIYVLTDPIKNGMADANWVARKIAPQMKVHYKTMSPRFIRAEVMRGDFHVSINYWTAWHARLKCLQDIHGDYGASYNMLHVLCDQILKSNPGSKACYSRTDEALGGPKRQGLEEQMKKLIPTSKSDFVLNANNQDTMPRLVKEALESTEASQTSSLTQALSSKAAKRVCFKCNHPGHNAKTCKGLPTAKKDKHKHGKKSQEETQTSQASAPVPDEAKKSTQASQAPEQRHTFGDFLSKQSGKSSTSVLEAAELTFTAGGTVRAPIATKRPRPHGPGSTPFMPTGPASQPWVPPGQVGDAAFKATKKILPPLAPSPLPTSRKKFQVVRPK
ncbi:hypothetical protein IFM89_011229 [Coptis chinensis]|uniref:CCHC-type domain-containing protein n=1 Tax=Coptis chinensis TaxID=261450 RepID=A0A835HJ79_9MAGN|nr:hypothetical protein IFM89_011229 [Coptis chinensis]